MKVIKARNGSYDWDWSHAPKNAAWDKVGFPQTDADPWWV